MNREEENGLSRGVSMPKQPKKNDCVLVCSHVDVGEQVYFFFLSTEDGRGIQFMSPGNESGESCWFLCCGACQKRFALYGACLSELVAGHKIWIGDDTVVVQRD